MLVISIQVEVSRSCCFIVLDIINHFLRNPGNGGKPERDKSSIDIIILFFLLWLSFWVISLIRLFLL